MITVNYNYCMHDDYYDYDDDCDWLDTLIINTPINKCKHETDVNCKP